MNLFILDADFTKNAEYHCNKHCVKQILEAMQCVATALQQNGCPKRFLPTSSTTGEPYRPTHINHPVVIWTGETQMNFRWVINYGLALCKEYSHRYDKEHKLEEKFKIIKDSDLWRKYIPKGFYTPFKQCFGENNQNLICKNPVDGYRLYYNLIKRNTIKMEWKRRDIPKWYRNFDERAWLKQELEKAGDIKTIEELQL